MPKTDKKLKSLKEAVSEKIDTSFQIKVTKMPVPSFEVPFSTSSAFALVTCVPPTQRG